MIKLGIYITHIHTYLYTYNYIYTPICTLRHINNAKVKVVQKKRIYIK